MSAPQPVPTEPPQSDVSPAVGLVGVVALVLWVLAARFWPELVDSFGFPGPRAPLIGPNAALTALVVVALPMVAWAVFVDKVHLRPSTGIDWSMRQSRAPDRGVTATKVIGLWATWLILACLFCLCRWYWQGDYLLAIKVLAAMGVGMVMLSIPYVRWLDRVLVEPRDHAWHFGAMLTQRAGWDVEEVKRHWRAWLIKAFFGAFMLSIVPANFANVVSVDANGLFQNPVRLALWLINVFFLMDVMIGTVGYIVTLRPLDAHIRSGNPFLSGWVSALICYPPLAWGILGNGLVLSYEHNVADWAFWADGHPALLWLWGGWLVFLTAIYAWATFAFGIRFSNLTYRGVLTNGPFRFTRHPAYVSKNLFWWCSVLPFLVTNGSMVDAIRNCFFLLCVNGIYYWRAKTEEAHLLAEDEKYRAYHAWMAQHGLLTAPLTRLINRVVR